MRAEHITIYTKNGSWGCRVLLPLVILKGRKNELTKILIDFNLEVLITAWDKKKPLCCKLQEEVEKEKIRWSQIRGWDAVVRTGIKMLKSKQELKISNLFLWGSVGLEGKMNDERVISQTPIAHKLDVLST